MHPCLRMEVGKDSRYGSGNAKAIAKRHMFTASIENRPRCAHKVVKSLERHLNIRPTELLSGSSVKA
jgi:hypothetical protein